MSFDLFVTMVLSFLLGYTVTHYSLTSWGVRTPISIVLGVLFGVLVAVFATLAVSPLIGA